MKAFLLCLVCSSLVLSASSDPAGVRPARQELDEQATTTDLPTTDSNSVESTEPSVRSGPYPPSGWRPMGPLLVLPIDSARGENVPLASPTPFATVRLQQAGPTPKCDEAETTEAPNDAVPNSQLYKTDSYVNLRVQTSGQLRAAPTEQDEIAAAAAKDEETKTERSENREDSEEVEKSEPKALKESGKLKVDNSETPNEKDDSTTEAVGEDATTELDEKSSTDRPSANLETTSEPDSEAVEGVEEQSKVAKSPEQPRGGAPVFVPSASPVILLQLSDGTFQRIVLPFAPQSSQPLTQNPLPQPFAFNAPGAPRVFTYTSQYQSF